MPEGHCSPQAACTYEDVIGAGGSVERVATCSCRAGFDGDGLECNWSQRPSTSPANLDSADEHRRALATLLGVMLACLVCVTGIMCYFVRRSAKRVRRLDP